MRLGVVDGKSAITKFFHGNEAKVRISVAAETQSGDSLFDSIRQSQCTRLVYNGRVVGLSDLAELEQAANVDRCRVVLVADLKSIKSHC
jgi:hypothetical protein